MERGLIMQHQIDVSETDPEPEGNGAAPAPRQHSKNVKHAALRPTRDKAASGPAKSANGVEPKCIIGPRGARREGRCGVSAGSEVTAPQPVPETDWGAVTQEIKKCLKGWTGARRDWLEDAVQDAALCMFVLASKERIEDLVAFGVSFVRRRWIDELRRRRRRKESLDPDLDPKALLQADRIGTVDWQAMLRQAGWEPTEASSRILRSIASGYRGTNKIARALGLNRKTVHQSRKRLQRWLEEKLGRPPAPRRQ